MKLGLICCCGIFSAAVMAQPPKSKAAKPAAPVAKKVDYTKMKEEIRSLYRDDKYKEVITKATQYLAKFPKDTQVTMQKAVSQVLLKQYPVGFGLVKKFFTNADTAAKYVAIMAFSVPEKEWMTTGMACADEAIKMAPASPYGYFVKGGIYSDLGEHEKALPFLEQMSKTVRDDNERMLMASYYAKELAFNKQKDKAVAAIDELYKKYPLDEDIINTYAIIYRINESYGKAVEKYDELIKMAPDNMDYHLRKAATLFADGKTAECCTETELMIAKDVSYDFLRFRYKCPDYFASPAFSDMKSALWAVRGENSYNFSVSNIKGSAGNEIAFDWLMTSRPDMNGHINITKEAMEKAMAQNNYFGPDLKNATLTDKTTVWVSKAVISDIIKNGTCKMDVGSGEESFTLVSNTGDKRDDEAFEDKVTVKGVEKYLNTLHVKNEAGTHQLWILNDVNNPLIVKMELEWAISLKSIE